VKTFRDNHMPPEQNRLLRPFTISSSALSLKSSLVKAFLIFFDVAHEQLSTFFSKPAGAVHAGYDSLAARVGFIFFFRGGFFRALPHWKRRLLLCFEPILFRRDDVAKLHKLTILAQQIVEGDLGVREGARLIKLHLAVNTD
jgi:hypothetical protein